MKSIFRSLGIAAVVAGVAVTGAFAQTACDDLDGATEKYEEFTNVYQKRTEADLTTAIAAGKAFLEKWGECEGWKDQVAFVKPWVPRLEGILEDMRMFKGFDEAVNSDNVEGIYSFGKKILAKYPNNHNVKYVMAVVGLTDVSKAVQAKTQSKYASEAVNFSRTLFDGIKSGSIQFDRKLKDGTPSIGVLKHETNKEEALSRLAYTQGYVNYYGLNNKKAALPQYYEVTQMPGFFKEYSPVYATISDYYLVEADSIGKEIVTLTTEYNALVDKVKKSTDPEEVTKLDGEIKAKDAQIKSKEALYNGYLERAMDALARAHKVAKNGTPAEKQYRDALYKDLQNIYNRRFPNKTTGLDQWVASATAKPLPDPTSAVQPVTDDAATTTTTSTTGTGTGVGAASGTGVGAAKGTGIGAASGSGVAPRAGTTATKTKPRRR